MNDAVGSPAWNDRMYRRHPTPYRGLAGRVELARLKLVARWVRSLGGRRLLDLGCGEGQLRDLVEPSLHIVGADISIDSLEVARQGAKRPALVQADGTAGLPFRDGAFDVVVCTEMLEHVLDPASVVAELHRLCSPSGRVILTVPIERPKQILKALLRKTRLFGRLFSGIEDGFSEWHVQDFTGAAIRRLLDGRFRVRSCRRVLLMHRCLLLEPMPTGSAVASRSAFEPDMPFQPSLA